MLRDFSIYYILGTHWGNSVHQANADVCLAWTSVYAGIDLYCLGSQRSEAGVSVFISKKRCVSKATAAPRPVGLLVGKRE